MARVLPRDEWDRLRKDPLFAGVSPQDVDVVVVEDEGQIVASVLVMRTVHLESLWIDKEHRTPGTVRAMQREALRVARERCNGDWALVCVERSESADKLRRVLTYLHGVPLPVDVVLLPLGV